MIDNNLELARQTLLEPAELDELSIGRILGQLHADHIDLADLYFESTSSESWSLEDGIVKSGSYNTSQGVGIRVVCGDKTGFAYTDEIDKSALSIAATNARSITSQGQSGDIKSSFAPAGTRLYPAINPINSLEDASKVDLLNRINTHTRSLDPRVSQVMIGLSAQQSIILIANQDGELHADVRPLIRLNVNVVVESNGRRESGSAGTGGRYSYQQLLEDASPLSLGDEAVRQAVTNLDATAAPAGEMTVVLGPGWPGILLHEAIGHGLEGDFNRKGTSAFSGRIGERVASPLCTVVDDGTLPNRRGSLSIDDEGCPTQNTVLIENGILRAYMQDAHNAHLMGVDKTGNGRRQSYAHRPMPRMTNTYMHAGQHDPKEIIASVKNGLYAHNFGGGQVDITNGKFVFSASEAYLIKNGKITQPVKGATLIGNGPDVLTQVSMVGNDLKLDPGIGTCGKNGQSVPVGVGQPTVKINQLTVGGTSS